MLEREDQVEKSINWRPIVTSEREIYLHPKVIGRVRNGGRGGRRYTGCGHGRGRRSGRGCGQGHNYYGLNSA